MNFTVIVTGRSKGLGTAIALCLLESGMQVFGTSRSVAPKELLKFESYHHLCHDLEEGSAVIYQEWLRVFGRIDAVVHCYDKCLIP